MRRKARQERRGDRRGGGSSGIRYQMREKLIAFGDDFFIEDAQGDRVYKVDGKALRVRDTLKFKDMQGNVLCQVQEKKVRIKDTMDIEDANGDKVASIKKALISPIRDRWVVKIGDGPDMDVKGNIVNHEYKIEADGDTVAEVSKKWFRVRDSYGVEVVPGQKDIIILAVTVAIDMMAHD